MSEATLPAIADVAREPTPLAPPDAVSTLVLPASPYKGLIPYVEQDAPFFFGREDERELITANLQAARLTLLYGASGVGKSSVLHAGVVHHLRRLARQNLAAYGSPEFAVVAFSSWRDDPLTGLLDRIEKAVADALNGRAVAPVPPSRALVDSLQAWTERLGGDLLIILDQFEEYFLYHGQEEGQGTFAAEFPRAVNRPDLRVNFLVSIREDALAKLDRFKGSIPNLFANYLRIEHLDREAARAAIEKPLEQYNRLHAANGQQVTIEPALLEAVLEQVKTGQVMLGETGRGVVAGESSEARIETPYLQLVMTRLWDEELREGSRILRLITLERLGGAERIVRTHLDATMDALPSDEQAVAASVFRHLVTPSGAKIAHTASDLADYAGLPQGQLTLVLEKLSGTGTRILRPVAPPPDQPAAPRYEIFHDVLAAAVLDWRTRYVQAREQAEAKRQLARERGRGARLRLGLVGLSGLLIAMVALAIFAFQRSDAAERARADALAHQQVGLSRELAASAMAQLPIDPELSVLLATEAARVGRTEQAEDALRQAVIESKVRSVIGRHEKGVWSLAFSPDGKRLLTASEDMTARVWELSTGQSIELRGHTAAVNRAAFSNDGKLALTVGWEDPAARVWDASTGQSLAELRHPDKLTGAVFSPDGKLVVTTSWDDTAQVWEVSTGRSVAVLRGHTDDVFGAAFSPEGEWLVTVGADKVARVWDTGTWQSVAALRGHTSWVINVAFSPDGRWVATGSYDNTARVWDTGTWKMASVLRGQRREVISVAFSPDSNYIVAVAGTAARIWKATNGEWQYWSNLRDHTDWVVNAAFRPDGKRVVTASQDGSARVWEVESGRTVEVLRGHADSVNSAAFSPDGKLVATASADNTIRLWEPTPGRELRGHTDWLHSAAFSPDGKWVVTASGDNTARVWDAETGASVAVLEGHFLDIGEAKFSPDGRRIVTASWDGTARIWDVTTWETVRELRGPDYASIYSAAFSPDGKLVITAGLDKTARVWDAETGASVAELTGHAEAISAVTFSPDGKLIATASQDKTARVWDTSTWQHVAELRGHAGGVTSADFSPDSRWLATASQDKTARVWDLSTWQTVSELRGHSGPLWGAEFSPNGSLVVTASVDGTARVWQASTGRSLAELRGHMDFVDQAAFSPDGKSIVTASGDGTAQIFACEVCRPIEDLLALASTRVTRQLTTEERAKYLREPQPSAPGTST